MNIRFHERGRTGDVGGMLELVRGEVGAVVANEVIAHRRHFMDIRMISHLGEDVARPLDAAAAPHAVGESASGHHLHRRHPSVHAGIGDV